ARPWLVKAAEGNRIAAMGLLTPSRRKRLFLSVDQLCLHESGRTECDAVMIEHNNFLIAKQAPPGLVADVLRALQAADANWDEIVLSGIAHDIVTEVENSGLRVAIDRISPDFGVALSGQDRPSRWEDSLSSNQRAQLRQSRGFAERIGPIALKTAISPS